MPDVLFNLSMNIQENELLHDIFECVVDKMESLSAKEKVCFLTSTGISELIFRSIFSSRFVNYMICRLFF